MTLRLEDKKEIVAAVNQVAAGAFSAVVADYRGLTVEQLTKLRTSARQQGVYLRVVRNTLARRAFEGTPFAILNDTLPGGWQTMPQTINGTFNAVEVYDGRIYTRGEVPSRASSAARSRSGCRSN